MGYLLFNQRIGQLEALMFIGARIKDHAGTGAQAFDLGDIVRAKSTALVKAAGVCKHVAAASPIDVKLDTLTAHRTLGVKGMKSPASY